MNEFLLSIFKSEYPISQGYFGNWWDEDKNDGKGAWAYLNADGTKGIHGGTDIACRKGTPIYAPFGGKIEVRDTGGKGYGLNLIIIEGNKKFRIGHLSQVGVPTGTEVEAGQLIAFSGNTGYSTAAHAHVEVWIDGKRIDPKDFELEKNAHDGTWAWGLVVGLCTEKSERKRQLTFEETVTVLNRLVKHLEPSLLQQPETPSGK